MEQLLGEIIVGVLALAGSLIGNYFSNRKSQALIEYRLDQLENKVTQNNDLIDRVSKVETAQAVQEDQIKSAHKRIDGLEKK